MNFGYIEICLIMNFIRNVKIIHKSIKRLIYIIFKKDLEEFRIKLAESENINKQLKIENRTLHAELQDIRHEMEELQDQFRLDDADEFRQLQAELEIAAKNCRILQFKLRKIEKRNENLENDKILLQGTYLIAF